MTLELLAVPSSLAHIQGIRLCPAKCVGGMRPDAFEPVEDSELEHVLGPECETCGGTGIDPACYEGCCDEPHATIVIGGGGGFRLPGRVCVSPEAPTGAPRWGSWRFGRRVRAEQTEPVEGEKTPAVWPFSPARVLRGGVPRYVRSP